MTSPAYMRPSAWSYLWGFALILACVLGLSLFWRGMVNAHDDGVRQAVYQTADAKAAATITMARMALAGRIDALTKATAQRDTVLVEHTRTVYSVLNRVDTLHDTVTAVAVRACSALADDCTAFRATALTTIAAHDSAHALDSLALRSQSIRYTVDLAHVALQRDARPSLTVCSATTGSGFLAGFLAAKLWR